MELEIGLAIIAIFLASLILGLWAFGALALTAVFLLISGADFSLHKAGIMLAKSTVGASRSWELSAIPLFLLMGELLFRADLSQRLFNGLAVIFNRVPGGLMHVNVVGCTTFAAVSGSSAATTATIGRISVPELTERGYSKSLILGSLAGAGSFGLLIPPSIAMIIYGVLAEVSIVKLFAAGVIPGLIVATFYSLYIMVVGRHEDKTNRPVADMTALLGLVPIGLLIFLVLGSIYGGIASPTEAASVGVFGALLLIIIERRLSWSILKESLAAATQLSCVIGAVVITASALSSAAGLVGLPQAIASWFIGLELSSVSLIFAFALFYIFLGLFLDGISIMVLTLPLTLPIVIASGIDPIWFGVFIVLMIEIGLMTPPVGFNLFVIKSISDASIGDIAKAAIPFFLIMCGSVILFSMVPEIVLWLPNYLFTPTG